MRNRNYFLVALLTVLVAGIFVALSRKATSPSSVASKSGPVTATRSASAVPGVGDARPAQANPLPSSKRQGMATMAPAVATLSPKMTTERGDVDIVLQLLGAHSGGGWVDIEYDAGVLTLANVTSAYDPISPGIVRVQINLSAEEPTGPTLTFSATDPASATLVHAIGGRMADGSAVVPFGVAVR